jgi:hypothetical protein
VVDPQSTTGVVAETAIDSVVFAMRVHNQLHAPRVPPVVIDMGCHGLTFVNDPDFAKTTRTGPPHEPVVQVGA